MIAESKFNKKKKENRAAALVALAAEKKSGVSPCLTDEEMVVLVAGSCSDKEKERAWAHLADCPQCYEQWYSLKMKESGACEKSGIVYLMRPRNFALIGSALAVAASVVVFLNVFQTPFSDYRVEEPVQSQQIAEEKEISFAEVTEVEVEADRAVSLRKAPSKMYKKMEMKMKDDRSLTPPQAPEKLLGTSGMMAAKVAGGLVEKDQPVERWLEIVQEGCLKRQTEVKFWSEIVVKGDQIFKDTEPGPHLETKESRAFEVFRLVPRKYEADLIASRCEQILVKLAEAEESR